VLFCHHYTKSTFRIEERPKIVPMFTRSVVISSVSSKYSYVKATCDQHSYECLLQWKSNKHYIFWVVYVASFIQTEICIRCNIICGLLSFTVFFQHYHINGKIFEKRLLNMKCVFFLYYFCRKHSSFNEKLSELWSKMHIVLHVKYQLLLSDFNENTIFSQTFRKIIKYFI
jgi:hypothetical protein